MSLADVVAAGAPRPKKGPPCSMQYVLGRMSTEDRDALNVMLTDAEWTGRAVSDALFQLYGVRVNGEVVNRHRRGACSC